MNKLTQFINNELYPRIWDNVQSIFPEKDFTLKGSKWISPYHITDGHKAKDGQGSYISAAFSGRIADCNGQCNKSIVDFYIEQTGKDFIPAVRELCGLCGLELPEGEHSSEYSAYQTEQNERFRQMNQAEEVLFSQEGRAVLEYLEQRGYTKELIKKMRLGALSPTLAKEMEVTLTHPLVIPFYSKGVLLGFKFRAIEPVIIQEQKKYKNSKGLLKSSLFALNSAKYNTKEIIIVEGELDCLRAKAMGIPNIVALAGSSIPEEGIKDLQSKGIETITFIPDTEAKDNGIGGSNATIINSIIQKAQAHRLKVYIAALPGNGEKVDTDSYLATHTVTDLLEIVRTASSAIKWQYGQLLKDYKRDCIKDITAFKEAALELIAQAPTINQEEKLELLREITKDTYNQVEYDSLQKELADITSQAEEERAREALQNKIEQAYELTSKGRIEEATALLKSVSSIKEEKQFAQLLDENIEALFDSYKHLSSGLETFITLKDNKQEYKFYLPSGALSIIAAATGHGKSRLLQSLAIEQAKKNIKALYITFEENRENVNRQLLNVFANITLTNPSGKYGNEQTLAEYLRNNSTQYIQRSSLQEFEEKLEDYKALRKDKLLLVHPENNTINYLCGLVRSAIEEKNTQVIFIDYIQEIYVENSRAPRTDDLKEICVLLDQVAQEYNIPIVVAAQLKAETESPLTMANQDIADSINISRKASEVLLLWSSKELPKRDTDGAKERSIKEKLGELGIGQPGRLYARLTKSRLIPTGTQAFLTINGNTGRVSQPQPGQNNTDIARAIF